MARFATNESFVESFVHHPEAALNYEGGLAYRHDPKETLAKMAACCLVNEKSFYGDTTGRIFELVKEVGREDPEWLVKLSVFLREELKLRSISHYMTAVCLSLPKARKTVAKAFDRLTPRTDDLIEVGALLKDYRYGIVDSLPHVVRDLIAKRLNRLTEIEVIKYRNPRKFGLKHLIRMTHPKPVSPKQKALFQYVVARRKFWDKFSWEYLDLVPQIADFEDMIRTSKSDTSEIIRLVERGKLPWEVVLPLAGSRSRIWKACAKSMPIMALIRNLRNLHKHRVLKDKAIRELVLEKLRNREVILNSRQLPFRWLSAVKVMQDFDPEIADALRGALEISIENLPRLSGRTFISADNSGSMTWGSISKWSSLCPADIANLLGAMVLYLSDEGYASVFAEDFALVPVSKKDSITTNCARMENTDVGQATNAHKVMDFLLRKKIFMDRIIILTDMIIYSSDGSYEDGVCFMHLLKAYRRQVNPKVRTYIVNLQPYEYFISPSDELGVTTISGWSESVLKYIEYDSLEAGQSMADVVGRIQI